MEALTRSLFSVCLCIQVTQTDGSSWTAKVPSSVKGLLGSCVIIPCSFDYPQPKNKQISGYTGIWNDDRDRSIYHPDKENILENYQDRTTLLGDVSHKNCSLKIDDIRSSDQGPFHFRIEMKDYDGFSYIQNKVSISVIDESQPINLSMVEEISEGQSVSPSCSVFYSCPTSYPVFNWSHSGEQRFHSQELSDGQWEATSTLTFRPTCADHNKSLQCSVQMHNGKPLQTQSKVLRVKCLPNVIGCIDGTQIPITAPTQNEGDYVNRKSFHSINVQIICDAASLITNVEAKWPGSVHDSRIYRECSLSNRFARGEFDGYLLGDRGYPCQPFLLTPYPDPEPGPQQRFNVAHCRTRARVEMTIGILKSRFQCLRKLRVTPERACDIIVACVVLHNIAIIRGEQHPAVQINDAEDDHPIPADVQDGRAVRDLIAQ